MRMKRAPWYVATGAVAGFAAVIGLHGRGAAPAALARPGASGPAKPVGGQAPPGRPEDGAGAGRPAASAGTHTATGVVEQYGYGELAVKVTVRGSAVTAVSVPLLRTAEPFSQQLAEQAIPMLRSEVLAAHGARINGVSGATYTSEAYAASLQSALDKLHLR
jgi:uncharacterized protein with FMN-binding domain